jgi:hypothetical protein
VARGQTPWRRPPARSPLDREIALLAIPAEAMIVAAVFISSAPAAD